MPWFKVDDQLDANKKVKSIPRRNRAKAMGLWVQAGAWCARELTDGFVPDYMIEEFAVTPKIADELVTAGMWEKRESGYFFVNWTEFQPSSNEVRAKKSAEAKRKAEWRATKKAKAEKSTTSKNEKMSQRDNHRTDAGTTTGLTQMSALPDPTRPDPSLTTTSNEVVERTTAQADGANPTQKKNHPIPDGWMPKQSTIDKMRAERPDLDLETEHRNFTDYWQSITGAKARKADWDKTWLVWMRKQRKPTTTATTHRLTNAEATRQLQEKNNTTWQPPQTTNQPIETWFQHAIGS